MVIMEEVKMTIGRDGKVTLHFKGMKAQVRHGLAEELEKLIGPASERQHGPGDEEIKGRMHLHVKDNAKDGLG
jgi:hypothetical protein